MVEIIISFFLLAGAAFALIGSIGLFKLGDFYSRLHGPTKSTTLGVGGMLVASAIYFTVFAGEVSLHEILVSIFLFLTAPVSAHMASKAALHLKVHSISGGSTEIEEPGTGAALAQPEAAGVD